MPIYTDMGKEQNKERIILGIDPGTNIMGYGLICQQQKKAVVLTMGVLKLGKLPDHTSKLKRIFEFIVELIREYHPGEVALEAPFYGKNVQSMLKLGRAQGVAMAAAVAHDLPVFEYSPRKIKQSITGKGSASKEQVAQMLLRLLELKEMPDYLDATDALAAAMCHYFQKDPQQEQGTRYTGWKAFLSQHPDRQG